MQKELKQAVVQACNRLFSVEIDPVITRPEKQFGDYATNVALQLAGQTGKNPRQIAEQLAAELQQIPAVAQISLAGPGFINFKLTDESLAEAAQSATDLPKPLKGRQILVEFGDPNPFKEMHIGHLYSYIVGDAIASLLESSGAKVKRLSYHGDVGLHVAKAIYGLGELQTRDEDILGKAYSYGNEQYEKDQQAKAEIDTINQHIYSRDDQRINQLHEQGIKLSFEYFDKILNMLSISTDKRYFESQTTPAGLELVNSNKDKVFKLSQGAVVYEGEKAGLHTRVFITSKGLPTYETKDLGLVMLKDTDYPDANRSIVITASEQAEYFKVMLAALAEIKPDLTVKTTHLSHGFLSLASGKMSSRTGNVYTAMAMLNSVRSAMAKKYPDSADRQEIYVAATKYSMLNHRLGQDIVIDVEASVSLEGNSGPYLQYAFARANSILEKSTVDSRQSTANDSRLTTLDSSERSFARKIGEYPEVVERAVAELMPHHICTYLYELAQTFNGFYEKSRIIGDEREEIRLKLVKSYSQVLRSGLSILSIEAPERM
ncbi:MAG TPA: arginine--tRNA ligase [Candidatus Saccharimonadales bacterium]|nr:arginine--tRNA ligase [Candidatus Saccharimonadales bacterium]